MGKQIIARGQATIVTQKDSYTINQSVGEYIFTAQTNGTIQTAVTVVSTVKVTLGDSDITNFTIGTVNKPNGFASINVNNTNKTITYTVAANTTTLADNGTILVPVIIEGVTYTISFKWAKSKTGQNGAAGVGIKSIVNKYAISSSNTTVPTSWSTTVPTMTVTNRYLWNYEIVTYTNGSTNETEKRIIGVYGNTGNTGNGISSITEYYLASASSSGVTTSTSGWTTAIQTTSDSKKYLWNYEVVQYTNGSRYTSKPVIIGTHGNNGATGPAGKPGADGYTISASRQSYVISTDKDGKIHSAVTTNTTISVLKGSTSLTPTIGALPTVAGCTLSKSGATVTIVFNVGTSLAENGTIDIPVVADGKSFIVSFSYAKARTGANGVDSNMLDWVKDWNNNKTQINENSVITPKIFAGTKNSNGTLTGVAIGKFPLSVLNPSGTVTTETINGIYGFKDGYKTFYVDNTGDAGLGKGNQFIRYNATTGKIEFGSDVSLQWTKPIETINTALGGKDYPKLTYIDSKGIYTGTLTAEQVNAVSINASSIKTGTLSADRIAAGSINASKIAAETITSDKIVSRTITADKIQAGAITANEIKAGTITSTQLDANSIKTNIINTAYIQGLTLSFTKGTIGGWSIDGDSIFKGTKNNTSGTYTSASGAMTIGSNGIRGFKWRLDSSGAGALAGGNISWDASGNVTFSSNVSLNWTNAIDALKPKLTKIDANGIYTGTINASQITAGTISAGRIDVNALKSSLITAGNIEALTLNIGKGKIGGWNISGSAISKNSVSLGSDGSITNGTKWKLNNDGSGQLANGNIKWDAAGTLTFGSDAIPEMKDYKEYIIEAGSLNQNTYYPVCMQVDPYSLTTITVVKGLYHYSDIKPSWGTHSKGTFSVMVSWQTSSRAWGEIEFDRKIMHSQFLWTKDNIPPVIKIGQLGNSGREYVFVRGGGIYVFRIQGININNVKPVLYTSKQTWNDQSIEPYTPTDWNKVKTEAPVARMTKIDQNGIYTGTLTANQINAANCNFTQGKIGGFTIYGHKMSTYDNPENGHIIEIHKTGYICNSRKSDSKDWWALNSDGSAVFGMGKSKFNADGSGYVANNNFKWDTSGTVTINGNFIMTGKSSAKVSIDYNGNNFFRINDGSMVSVRGDGRTALSVSTYGSNSNTKGIYVLCNGTGKGYAIESYGNVLLRARNSEKVTINGLHVNARNISSSTTLLSSDDFVSFSNTGGITVYMPSNVNAGKIIYMKKRTSRAFITLKGKFREPGSIGVSTDWGLGEEQSIFFIKDTDGCWVMYFCG